MRLFGGFERKLAVDGHGEFAGSVRGKKVGRALEQFRTCGNVIRKMWSRKEHRTRLSQLERVDGLHQTGGAAEVYAQTASGEAADAARNRVLSHRVIDDIHAFACGDPHHLIAKVLFAVKDDMVGAALLGDDGLFVAKQRGADHVILYREQDFRDELMRITAGQGVDVVYDAVGKDTIARSIRSLARRGLCVNFGGASGLVQTIDPLELAEAGSVFFTRPHLADYIATRAELLERAADLFAAYTAGKLTVTIDREFPLEAAEEAHRRLEGRGTQGKLLLRI